MAKTYDEILATEYSPQFDEHFKYGYIKENCENHCVDLIATLQKRVKAYEDTGNTEFLADVANFAMIEYMYPQLPGAHYTPTDSDKSPGIVGMSMQEMKDFDATKECNT